MPNLEAGRAVATILDAMPRLQWRRCAKNILGQALPPAVLNQGNRERLPYNVAVDVRDARRTPNWGERLQVARQNTYELRLLCFTFAQKNSPTRAEREHFTIRAIRLARETAATSVPDEPVTPQRPIALRHNFHQIALDFFCIPVLR